MDTTSLPAPAPRGADVASRTTAVDNVDEESLSKLTEGLAGADRASVMASPYRHFWTEISAMKRIALREMENEKQSGGSPGKDAAVHASNNTKPPATGKGRHGYVS